VISFIRAFFFFPPLKDSLIAQTVKNLPAMQETRVRSLGCEDTLRRQWQSTPVFLHEEFHGQRSLVSCSPWSCKDQTWLTYTSTVSDKPNFSECFQNHQYWKMYCVSVELWKVMLKKYTTLLSNHLGMDESNLSATLIFFFNLKC